MIEKQRKVPLGSCWLNILIPQDASGAPHKTTRYFSIWQRVEPAGACVINYGGYVHEEPKYSDMDWPHNKEDQAYEQLNTGVYILTDDEVTAARMAARLMTKEQWANYAARLRERVKEREIT